MKQVLFEIDETKQIADNTYETVLLGDTDDIRAGQFVNVQLPEKFLRRPISVCDAHDGVLTLIYKAVGEGTDLLASYPPSTGLDVLTGLGNGYDLSVSGDRPLLIGGGAGVPPLYMLCKELIKEGKKPQVLLGFNTKDEVFYQREFESLGAEVTVYTADGSYGKKGFVTTDIPSLSYTYFYTCGPIPMLNAINSVVEGEGECSLEERMGCGFGACVGCTCKTVNGTKRICREGPVLKRSEIVWPIQK